MEVSEWRKPTIVAEYQKNNDNFTADGAVVLQAELVSKQTCVAFSITVPGWPLLNKIIRYVQVFTYIYLLILLA